MNSLIRLKTKSLGAYRYILILTFLVMLFLIVFIDFDDINKLIIILQLLLNVLVFVGTVYLFYDLFKKVSFKFMLSFYRYKIKIIYVIFLGILIVPVFFLLVIINYTYDDFNLFPTLLLLFSQMFLSGIISLILQLLFKDTTITISLFFLYISVELATFGTSKYLFHIMYFILDKTITFNDILILSMLNISFGLVSYKVFKHYITE